MCFESIVQKVQNWCLTCVDNGCQKTLGTTTTNSFRCASIWWNFFFSSVSEKDIRVNNGCEVLNWTILRDSNTMKQNPFQFLQLLQQINYKVSQQICQWSHTTISQKQMRIENQHRRMITNFKSQLVTDGVDRAIKNRVLKCLRMLNWRPKPSITETCSFRKQRIAIINATTVKRRTINCPIFCSDFCPDSLSLSISSVWLLLCGPHSLNSSQFFMLFCFKCC